MKAGGDGSWDGQSTSVISAIKSVTLNMKLKYLFAMVPIPKELAGSSFIAVPMFSCNQCCVSVHHPSASQPYSLCTGRGEKGGGWCDGAGNMTATDEAANIAAEAVEVFRLKAGQELLTLFVESQGNTYLPCLAVGPGLKTEAFFLMGIGAVRCRGGMQTHCTHGKLCGAL